MFLGVAGFPIVGGGGYGGAPPYVAQGSPPM